jgi:hypothetical protein
MSLIFRRGIANMANLKSASKVVCVGRNYAYVLSLPFWPPFLNEADERSTEIISRN